MEHVSTIGYAEVGSYWSTRFSWFTALNRIKSCSGPSIEQTCLFDALFVYVFHSSSMIFWKKNKHFQRISRICMSRHRNPTTHNERTFAKTNAISCKSAHFNWTFERALKLASSSFHQSNIFVLNRAKSKVSQWAEKNVLLKVHGYVIVKSLFSQPCPVTFPMDPNTV